MSTTTHSHPPHSRLASTTLDRLALRVGLALVSYARRRPRLPTREELLRRVEAARAADRRERQAERTYRLTVR